MNKRRNTQAFTFLAWVSFGVALSLMLIGIYTLKEPLVVKGYYLMGTFYLTTSAFVLQKVIRDNHEDSVEEKESLFKGMAKKKEND